MTNTQRKAQHTSTLFRFWCITHILSADLACSGAVGVGRGGADLMHRDSFIILRSRSASHVSDLHADSVSATTALRFPSRYSDPAAAQGPPGSVVDLPSEHPETNHNRVEVCENRIYWPKTVFRHTETDGHVLHLVRRIKTSHLMMQRLKKSSRREFRFWRDQ